MKSLWPKGLMVLFTAVAVVQAAGLSLYASEVSTKPKTVDAEAGHIRVGGDYMVQAIDRVNDRTFRIKFESVQKTGKFDTLVLDSDHVHVAVKVGQALRLSAEILSSVGSTADVAQVVVFFPRPEGHVPVWLLSNKVPNGELRGSRYLEMHSPVTDYVIM